MSDSHSDALVFFGATGDLAYKKIFPALAIDDQARPPGRAGDRRGESGLEPRPVSSARQGQRGEARRHRRRGVRQAEPPVALCRRRLCGPRDLSGSPQGTQRIAASGALPGNSAAAVRNGCGAIGESGLRPRRSRDCGKAFRPRPGLRAGTQPDAPFRFSRAVDFSHRPLSRQAAGQQHGRFPLRQRLHGAVLESQLYRKRADHHGGRLRRRRTAAASTIRPEPFATWWRITCSRSSPTSRWSLRSASTAKPFATRR